MSVMSAELGDEVVIVVDGDLDGELAPRLHEEIEYARGAARDGPHRPDRVHRIDEGGAAVLAAAASQLAADGSALTVHLPDGRVARVGDAAAVRDLLRPAEEH
jgi:anti-anti-sigma regulatory factor